MATLPPKHQQIRQTHAALIVQIVQACQNKDMAPQLEPALKMATENGWTTLVGAIRKVLDGTRDTAVLAELDEEDTVIIEAVLHGLQDPATLPDPNATADGAAAAPALASIIHAAGQGDVAALQHIGGMAESMQQAGGDMARIAGCIRPLINGERDPGVLCKGMGAQTEKLVYAILEELAKLARH